MKNRKDSKGRVLYKGEVERKDGYYSYQYYDLKHVRRIIYAKDLVTLRQKEKKVIRDIDDGIDGFSKVTLSQLFDYWIKGKTNLREHTLYGYNNLFDHYVRGDFGNKKVVKIKYSDVKLFYLYMLQEQDLSMSTVKAVHTLLHQVLNQAVRDNIIRKNPSDFILREISGAAGRPKKRKALTIEQQNAFMRYVESDTKYVRWLPFFTIMLGTGMRVSEILGLRWDDVDLERRMISVKQCLCYLKREGDRKHVFHLERPKSDSGVRSIPMFDKVYEAFLQEKEFQKNENNRRYVMEQSVDGITGFVFLIGNTKKIPSFSNIDFIIKKIVKHYNALEEITSEKEGREPVFLPKDLSCHVFRHTFCTRICEQCNDLKLIQSVMGHSCISVTMNIYADVTDEHKKETFNQLDGIKII